MNKLEIFIIGCLLVSYLINLILNFRSKEKYSKNERVKRYLFNITGLSLAVFVMYLQLFGGVYSGGDDWFIIPPFLR